MAEATYIQNGSSIDYTPSGAVAAGDVVVQGSLVGVAPLPIAAGELGAIAPTGVFDVVKAAEAVSAGDFVYWDAGAGAATTTSTSNTLMGKAVRDAAIGDATVRVRLDQ